jgi:hypothetical protein
LILHSLRGLFEEVARSAAVQIRRGEERCRSDIRLDFEMGKGVFGGEAGAEAEEGRQKYCLTW